MNKASDLLTRDEIRALVRRSDLAGWWAIASTWAIIAATFAALARWPHPLVFALAVIVLGGRQLALAILMHEAAHRTLFATRAWNDVAADWLCARPVGSDVARYRAHHLAHHAHTSGPLDPDRSLSDPFPVTRRALARKLARDVTGVSGLRRALGVVLIDLELLVYTVAGDVQRAPRRRLRDHLRAGLRHLGPVLLTNAALFGALAAAGHAWIYAAWVVAYLTTFGLFLRIRSLAEHACTERTDDPLRNTRTTRAGVLARVTVAPLHVNYHLEHHLLVAVPYFRLPAMHRLLRARGAIDAPGGYADVLAAVTRATPA